MSDAVTTKRLMRAWREAGDVWLVAWRETLRVTDAARREKVREAFFEADAAWVVAREAARAQCAATEEAWCAALAATREAGIVDNEEIE